MDTILDKLLTQPLLDLIPEEEVRAFAPMVGLRQVRSGEIIFQQGDLADYFYLLASGEVAVMMRNEQGQEEQINLLYPGDFFGDVSFITEQPRGVTMVVLEEGELLYMAGAEMLRLRAEVAGFAERMNQLGNRIETRSVQTFDGQQEGEVVLHMSRQHWAALMRQLTPTFLFTAVWLGIVVAIVVLVQGDSEAVQRTWLWSLPGFFVLFCFGLWNYVDWYVDLHIFTNRRVILVERTIGFLNNRTEISLPKIQSVRVETPNAVEAFLDYSTMIISTASQGESGALVLEYVADAETIGQQIMVELNRFQKSHVSEKKEVKRRAVLSAIGEDPAGDAPPAPPPAPPRRPPIFGYFYPVTREQTGKKIVWRKHPIILLADSWAAWTAFIVTLYLAVAVPRYFELAESALRTWWVVIGIFMLCIVGWIWWLYDDWHNDRYILTEATITDEDIKPLGFHREVRSASLDSIQDIRYEQTNTLEVLLNVGRVLIQTAGQEGQFVFRWVKEPAKVQADINQYVQERKEARERQEAENFREEVLELITIYDEHRRGGRPSTQKPPQTPPTRPPAADDSEATRPSRPV